MIIVSKVSIVFFFLLSFQFFTLSSSHADTASGRSFQGQHVVVEVFQPYESIASGSTIFLGVRFVPEKEWHVYWKNPGDSGSAPKLNWQAPAGIQEQETLWPTPERIAFGPLMNFGYSKPVTLLTPFQIATSEAKGRVVIELDTEWLVCREECIPGSTRFSIPLKFASNTSISALNEKKLEGAKAQLPLVLPAVRPRIVLTDEYLQIEFTKFEVPGTMGRLSFFPDNQELIQNAAPQQQIDRGEIVQLRIDRDRSVARSPLSGSVVSGVVGNSAGWNAGTADQGLVITAPLTVLREAVPSSQFFLGEILSTLLLAFLGGLLLNVMPCVFPILSIKVLGLLESAGKQQRVVRRDALVFLFGVASSFLVLSGALIALRASGESLGWGFQLQSPLFVALMALFLTLLALNFSGVFEWGMVAQRVAARIDQRHDNPFVSGVVATLVATPCTAPFMGTAIASALVQPVALALSTFLAIALGFALPFVVLCWYPKLLSFLPRPGAWMETARQFLAFPIWATVIWLAWVFALQRGTGPLINVLVALLLLSFSAWVYGKISLRHSLGRRVGQIVLAVFGLLGSIVIATSAAQESSANSEYGLPYETYSRERVKELQNEGRWVYVDFTAAWCVTCQVNKKVVFSSATVRRFFEEEQIVILKADWTDENAEIEAGLQSFGRNGVPLNVIFSPYASRPPVILPSVLTPATVIEAFKESLNRM